MAATVPAQRRTPTTGSCGAPYNAAGYCMSTTYCLATELDLDVAEDLRIEACDDE